MKRTTPPWWRVPAWLARRRARVGIACLLALGMAVPAACVLLAPRDELARALANLGLHFIERDPTLHRLLEEMEPARRAALPARLEGEVGRLLPVLGVLGLAGATALSTAWLLLGRFVDRRLAGSPPDRARGGRRASPAGRAGPCAAACAGLVAHLPFLGRSLNLDEAGAALYASSSWWSWADTTLGWQNHVGGMLLVRISTALLGVNEWSVRLPAALASAAGLGVTYAWVRGAHGRVAGALTTGLIAALPLWAEQTALCRGYGLAFLAGAIGLSSLWKLVDAAEPGGEGRIIGWLFFAHFAGFLAHFFFLFFSVASLFVLFLRARRMGDPVAAAAMVWVVLALVPGMVLYAPGLPTTLYQTRLVPRAGLGATQLAWFVDDLGFRLGGAWKAVAMTGLLAAAAGGMALVSRTERRRIALVLGVAIGLPLLLRPVYFYPRFLVHLLPLLWLAALPAARALERLLPEAATLAASLVLAAALWALPRPWSMEPAVDLREATAALMRSAKPGETVAAESGMRGMLFYGTGDRVRFQSLAVIPPDARLVALGHAPGAEAAPPPGFREVVRVPGREVVVVIYSAIPGAD